MTGDQPDPAPLDRFDPDPERPPPHADQVVPLPVRDLAEFTIGWKSDRMVNLVIHV
jgi:hypothetical protein